MLLVYNNKINQSLKVQLEVQTKHISTIWISAGTTTVSTFWLPEQLVPLATLSLMLSSRILNQRRSDFSAEMTVSFQHRFKASVVFQQRIKLTKDSSLTSAISSTLSRLPPRFIKLSETWTDILTPSSSATEWSTSWVVWTATYQNGISFTRSTSGPQCKYSPSACHSWEWRKVQQPFYLHPPVKFHGQDIQFITQQWQLSTWWLDVLLLRTLITKSELTLLLQATCDRRLLEAIRISKMLWPQSRTAVSLVKQPWTLHSWATPSQSQLVKRANSLIKSRSHSTSLSRCCGREATMPVSWMVRLWWSMEVFPILPATILNMSSKQNMLIDYWHIMIEIIKWL